MIYTEKAFDIPEGWSQVTEGMWQEGDRFYNWDEGFWDRLVAGCREFVNEYECVIRPNEEEENRMTMTDEEIAAKIPAGYYRVDEGEYRDGDLAVFTTASKLGFSPVCYTHVGCEIRAPYVVARPMQGYPHCSAASAIPEEASRRKEYPIHSGLIAYFPDAVALVAHLSYEGNKQHHPEKPLHWDRDKSTDHLDALQRHNIGDIKAKSRDERMKEKAKKAWRALADLQDFFDGKGEYAE